MRRLFFIVLLVGGFWFVTTHLPKGLGHFSLTGSHAGSSALDLTEAQAAPEYDAEEQNNIAVYKRVLPGVW